MALLELIQRANHGDESALAQLIQIALPTSMQVQVRLKRQLLQILLDAPQSDRRVTRSQVMTNIAQALRPVTIDLTQIYVYYSIEDAASPVWTEALSWQQLRAMVISTKSQTGIPIWLSEKPNLKTYWALIQTNFSVAKLLLVCILALYGVLFAKHYNVADFLEGNIGLINFIHGANLIFHEAGHVLFMVFGEFLTILGGSLNQILIPTVISGYFFFKGQSYSGAVTLAWVGENFWDVSIYASDASDMLLPLLGGDGSTHDWNWLLDTLGWLPYTPIVGHVLYGIGVLVYLGAIGLGIYYSQRSFELNH